MENRANIDIQERTFTEVTDLHTECDEIVRILFAILRKARSTRASPKQ